jgi:glycosyltransferase involved in cell wall biosynthesis
LADPHDPGAIAAALRQAVDDPVLAADLRARGLRRAAELDWRGFAAANLALYRRVLAGAA